ncbi:IclR family transcriptional regulator, partial [Mesorhizobium sp. M4A.F.Ca.ET.029.04.2.1]
MSDGETNLIEAGSASPQGGERRRGIDRVIMLLEALLRHRAPVRVGDLAK